MPSGVLNTDMLDAVTLLAMQRKLPVSGGRRGARAVPITTAGLWHHVLQHTDERYVDFSLRRAHPNPLKVLSRILTVTHM